MATSNLDVSVESSSSLERRMTVRVPTAEIEREVDTRLKKMGKTARLKGFRPGKVPIKVVRQRYGGQVRQEVVSDVIRTSFSRAVSQEQLNPAGGPAIEPLSGLDDEHFSYRATFEVYPEIELQGVDDLAIELPSVAIEAADVDAMILKLREQRAEWRAVERKAADGDRVTVDFVGKIGKEDFEGGEGKDVKIVLGAGQVLADFEKPIKGASSGDTKTAKVKFPKEYPTESLAGKKAVFEIDVTEVEEQILPELDDEFFAAFDIEEGGLDALKTEVESNMERELAERLRAQKKSVVLDAFLRANSVNVPNALVEQEIASLQGEAMQRMGIQDPKDAPPRDNFRAMAEQRVTLGLLVQELVAQKEIRLDPSRVDARIEELTSPYEQPEEAAQVYRTNRELMAQIESGVLEDQVVDFLLDHGKVTEKSFSFADFMGT